jgi:hypothetical protein
MSLLQTAIKSKIPLIHVRTDDPLFFHKTVQELTDREVLTVHWRQLNNPVTGKPKPVTIESFLKPGQLGILEPTEEVINWHDAYLWLRSTESTLLVMNQETPNPIMMDVGFVPVPGSLVEKFVKKFIVSDPKGDLQLIASMSGLSYSNMERIAQMAMTQYSEFTAKSVRAIRRQFFPVMRGLEEINPVQLFYQPNQRLVDWLKVEGRLFVKGVHPLVTPRGFLFTGPPGTGKSSGAKFLAHELQVPLYRLDMGMVLDKYLGVSDQRLNAALEQAESFAPCVLLLDEVEKLFEVSDGSGSMQRLLSYLLWWLQERTARVLVVMTTNNEAKIPPELHRAGRIDEKVEFSGLLQTQVLPFVTDLTEHLMMLIEFTAVEVVDIAESLKGKPSQAEVTKAVLTQAKLKLVKNLE